MPVNFLGLGGLFGQGEAHPGGDAQQHQNAAAQGQAQAGGGAGGAGQVGAAIQGQAIQAQNINEFAGNPWVGEVRLGHYNYVVANPFENMGIQYRAAAPRQRHVDAVEAVQNLASSFLMEGLEFTEIVVSRVTMDRLRGRVAQPMMFVGMDGQVNYQIPNDLIINTAMGPIKFICVDDKPKFDLSKYMETV